MSEAFVDMMLYAVALQYLTHAIVSPHDVRSMLHVYVSISNLNPTPCIHSCVGSSNDIHIVAAVVTLAFVLGIKTSFDCLSREVIIRVLV